MTGLFEKHKNEFTTEPETAKKLVSMGEAPMAQGIEATEHAAWTSVARVILNLHETITRY